MVHEKNISLAEQIKQQAAASVQQAAAVAENTMKDHSEDPAQKPEKVNLAPASSVSFTQTVTPSESEKEETPSKKRVEKAKTKSKGRVSKTRNPDKVTNAKLDKNTCHCGGSLESLGQLKDKLFSHINKAQQLLQDTENLHDAAICNKCGHPLSIISK